MRDFTLQRFILTAFSFFTFALYADVTGADPKLTGAPGDDQAACTGCHNGTALNGGPGGVKIVLAGGNTYTPGVTQRVQVQVSDSAQRRWGFELTARVARNPSSEQAGGFSTIDVNTRVMCADGRSKPCTGANAIEYVTHTQTGTRLGTTGGVTFEFDWTPPDSDVGAITLYGAANAANGNNQNSGDRIYTTTLEVQPAVVNVKPSLQNGGVVNAASLQAAIAPNTWLTITGTNLATTTRWWTTEELASGTLPASLDNVSVTMNGKPAYVGYVSPTRLQALSPVDDVVGPVEVRVKLNDQTSDALIAPVQSVSPGLFTADTKYLATSPLDAALPELSSLLLGNPAAVTAVKPGDTILLFGTGFGPTDLTDSGAARLIAPVTVTFGGMPATVNTAVLLPNLPLVYQFQVVVPADLAEGDQPVAMQLDGVEIPLASGCCYLKVGTAATN